MIPREKGFVRIERKRENINICDAEIEVLGYLSID